MRPSAVLLALAPVLVVGCTTSKRDFSQEFDAAGIGAVTADVERGDFSYTGDPDATSFGVSGTSYGHGGSASAAAEHEGGNAWTITGDDGTLAIASTSDYQRASVDFDVAGPSGTNSDGDVVSEVSLTVTCSSGDVTVDDVAGTHTIYGSVVRTSQLIGNADITATSDVDAEIWPYEGGSVYVESSGTTTLRLPYGGDYAIQVWGSVDHAMDVTDLGFDDEYFGDGYFAATTGQGSIQVTVYSESGDFQLLESEE